MHLVRSSLRTTTLAVSIARLPRSPQRTPGPFLCCWTKLLQAASITPDLFESRGRRWRRRSASPSSGSPSSTGRRRRAPSTFAWRERAVATRSLACGAEPVRSGALATPLGAGDEAVGGVQGLADLLDSARQP
jgi:hypothetical protein